MTSRPPDQNTPPPSPSTSSSAAQPRFRRLYDKLRSSLLKPRKFLSILYPFIHCFISKTLDYITIDTMYLHDGDNNVLINNSPLRLGWGPSEPEVEEEKLFFVPYRWWSEATESLGESIDVNGVLYTANSSLKDADIWGEIVIDLRSVDGSDHNKSGCSGGGGRAYALVAGTHLAVGTRKGKVQIWDASRCKKIRTMDGHGSRVGALAWGSSLLSSGSKDTSILQRDVRAREDFVSKLTGHKLEICGLKWSYDNRELASGGNDNKLFIWNLNSTQPVVSFCEHIAAVRAIAWSPHLYGLLASGGGTADRCIRFWNTTTNTHLSSIDTGSQVCNLVWSKNVNELVSTHGYSQNEIMVWRYPTMSKLATLIGHNCRVLYLAISPDGQTIVTGAGDETLKLWNVFPSPKSQNTEREIRSSFLGRTLIR